MARGRRPTYWAAHKFSDTVISTGAGEIVLADSSELHAVSRNPTIVRIRGRIGLTFDRGQNESTEVAHAWLGVACLHSDLSTTIDPANETDMGEVPWMWLDYFRHEAPSVDYPRGDASAVQDANRNEVTVLHEIDIKAMRKAPAPCALSLFHNAGALAGSPSSIKICGHLRWLIKE